MANRRSDFNHVIAECKPLADIVEYSDNTIRYNTISHAIQSCQSITVSLAFVRGIHRSPVNSPHKGPVTRKMFPFDTVDYLDTFEMSLNMAGNQYISVFIAIMTFYCYAIVILSRSYTAVDTGDYFKWT